jgi:hypothetical protein
LRALPAASIWRARPSPPRKLQLGFPRCGDGDSCREADPEHSAPCRGSGKQPCSDRRRRRFFGLRVWGLGLRLGLWKSGKRIVQAEGRIPRCGGFLVAGLFRLRESRGCCGSFLVAGTEPRRKLGLCRCRSDAASVAVMSCCRLKCQKLFPGRSFRSIIYSTFSVPGQRPPSHIPSFT